MQKATRVLATWDDHDYGENDAGSEYPLKETSKQIFLDFFGVAKDSPRRERDGVYVRYELADADVLKLCELVCGRLESELAERKKVISGR